jgi:hypothetical protein
VGGTAANLTPMQAIPTASQIFPAPKYRLLPAACDDYPNTTWQIYASTLANWWRRYVALSFNLPITISTDRSTKRAFDSCQ